MQRQTLCNDILKACAVEDVLMQMSLQMSTQTCLGTVTAVTGGPCKVSCLLAFLGGLCNLGILPFLLVAELDLRH